MSASEQPKATWLDRFRERRRERKERAAERARLRPDVEGSAEGALFRHAGRGGRAPTDAPDRKL